MMTRRIPISRLLLPAIFISCLFQACEKEEVKVSVSPKTYHVDNVTDSSATIHCTVAVEGGTLKEAGLCYSSTLNMPSVSTSQCIPSTGSLKDFTVTLSGLSADSIYRFVAYATMGDKTYYGAIYAFQPVNPEMNKDMVFVEGGLFTMGATQEQDSVALDAEKPAHQVTLSNFRMSKYEVTTAQFVVFLNSRKIFVNGSGITSYGKTHIFLEAKPKNIYFNYDSTKWIPVTGYENTPMTNVTWYGANEFCRWAGGHLPTEAQWEFAARGGRRSSGYVYSGGANPNQVAWYAANTNYQDGIDYFAQPVGGKTPNELGLYDMSGNVWEWCGDWYSNYVSAAVIDPQGMTDQQVEKLTSPQKVRRGGGWADNSSRQLRISNRGKNTPISYSGSVGFRMASRD